MKVSLSWTKFRFQFMIMTHKYQTENWATIYDYINFDGKRKIYLRIVK